jgi:uncharacterized protein YdeI (YjbR/CyaY-like superfamily)
VTTRALKPRFFRSGVAFRQWLDANHDRATELLLGFYKKSSGKGGITYAEALDEALCVGWIDGVRRGLDEQSYTIRFTPRKRRSVWSAVNIKRATELQATGRMKPAGLAAFAARDENRSEIYSYERKTVELDVASAEALATDAAAWAYYQRQPPWYRRTAGHWVMSAKRPETRAKRLAILIECSRQGKRIPPLSY